MTNPTQNINRTDNSLPASDAATPKGSAKAPDRRLNRKEWRSYWQRRFSELHLEAKQKQKVNY